MCFINTVLFGLQSAIKMINLIIPAAVRKGYKWAATCSILSCDIANSWDNFFMFTDVT